jgi:hypothetical protein
MVNVKRTLFLDGRRETAGSLSIKMMASAHELDDERVYCGASAPVRKLASCVRSS